MSKSRQPFRWIFDSQEQRCKQIFFFCMGLIEEFRLIWRETLDLVTSQNFFWMHDNPIHVFFKIFLNARLKNVEIV